MIVKKGPTPSLQLVHFGYTIFHFAAVSPTLKPVPSTQQIDFKGRRALVTGAGKGIGRRLPLCSIASTRRSSRSAERNRDLDLLRDGIGCQTILADLGNVADARQLLTEAGDIDLLVNNAAIAILESFLETKVESWDTTMAINLGRWWWFRRSSPTG